MSSVFLYNVARKYLTLVSVAVAPVTFFVDAPFGRFTPSQDSIFLVDGIKSWIFMELISPAFFVYAFLTSPLSPAPLSLSSYSTPQLILAAAYLIHYTNRALVSPLRTPSRSKSHISVPLSAISFNTANGALMGSYLASPAAHAFLSTSPRPAFAIGLALWAAGFAGNVYHDEILLNIRRNARAKGKANSGATGAGEHYAIPHGALYTYLSYPNYFCEWIEWAGFALAAAPVPSLALPLSLAALKDIFMAPASAFAPSLAPPYIFFFSEVLLMLPRAVNGHKWYHDRFGAAYPKERKAVIPWLI